MKPKVKITREAIVSTLRLMDRPAHLSEIVKWLSGIPAPVVREEVRKMMEDGTMTTPDETWRLGLSRRAK